jgi:hypothetical protein
VIFQPLRLNTESQSNCSLYNWVAFLRHFPDNFWLWFLPKQGQHQTILCVLHCIVSLQSIPVEVEDACLARAIKAFTKVSHTPPSLLYTTNQCHLCKSGIQRSPSSKIKPLVVFPLNGSVFGISSKLQSFQRQVQNKELLYRRREKQLGVKYFKSCA